MLFAATGGMQVYFVCAPQRNGRAIEVLKSKITVSACRTQVCFSHTLAKTTRGWYDFGEAHIFAIRSWVVPPVHIFASGHSAGVGDANFANTPRNS